MLAYTLFLIVLISLLSNRLAIENQITNQSRKITHFLFGSEKDFMISNFEDTNSFLKGFFLGIFSKNDISKLELSIEQEKLLNILNESLESSNRNYYSADLKLSKNNQQEKLKVKVRGKGDRPIHYENISTMSFRANLKGQDRLFGIEKFSIQHPIVRNYSWEYLISQIASQQGLIVIRSWQVDFYVNGDYKGIYSIEEVPSKETIEQQKRKNGPIFGLDEEISTSIDSVLDPYELEEWKDKDIYIYAKDLLYKSFLNAKNNKTFSSQIFDYEEWAKYFALMDVFGSYHGIVPKSVKYYFNPVIGKFQPILFDAHIGAGQFDDFALLDFISGLEEIGCEWICKDNHFFKAFLNDENFRKIYVKYLKQYTHTDFLDDIKTTYINNFKSLDNEFYSKLSPSDKISERGLNPYLFKFDRINQRQEMLEKKIIKFLDSSEYKSFSKFNQSQNNTLLLQDNVKLVHNYDFRLKGVQLNILEPTIYVFDGITKLEGLSKDQPLKINGPGMFIFKSEKTIIKNVIFNSSKLISIPNRTLSGAINIIDSDITIENLSIENSNAEDAINIVNSNFKISELRINSSFSDAIDLDFSDGYIENIICKNIGNDCLDVSESNVSVNKILSDNVEDKAISAGENSSLVVNEIYITNSAIGVVSKDGSSLNINDVHFKNVNLPIAVFKKKSAYKNPSISISNIHADEEIFGLFNESSNISITDEISKKILSSQKIENMLYGAVYGKATEK